MLGRVLRLLAVRRRVVLVDATTERADVLAYLQRRIANCATMAAKSPEFAADARERQRQLQVLFDDLHAGLHEGSAAVELHLREVGYV